MKSGPTVELTPKVNEGTEHAQAIQRSCVTVHNNSHTWLLYNVSETESYELGIHFCLERPVYTDSSAVPRGYPNRLW